MTAVIRLPVAPRPFGDELLSSWMARVATRYGLEAPEFSVYLAGQVDRAPALRQINDINPDREVLKLWARGCRIDPARLERLSLKFRHPNRPRDWLLGRAGGGDSACLACFDADSVQGHDAYMRADWKLAERVVCPVHREMLRDRCPACRAHLRTLFRMRHGRLRPFCRSCEGLLTSREGEPADRLDADFAGEALAFQRKAESHVKADSDRRARLEHAISTLWAPLDRAGAARPVLALWFDQPGWNCPFEARAAVCTLAPLQHLPVRWRALTLVVLHDLFGAELVSDGSMPEAAARLFRRAASMPARRQSRMMGVRKVGNIIDAAPGRVQRLSASQSTDETRTSSTRGLI